MKKFFVWIVILLLWSIVSYGLGAPGRFIPYPHEVVISFVKMLVGGNLWRPLVYNAYSIWPHLWSTLFKLAVSLVLGAAVGIPLGIAIGSFKKVRQMMEPPINFLRAIPITALFPLFLLALGIGDEAKVAMIAVGCGLVMVVGAAEGVRNAPREIVEVARLEGANDLEVIRYVSGYLALPHIYANFRVASSIGLIITVVIEMIVGSRGLGYMVMEAGYLHEAEDMYAVIILLGLIGIGLNRTLEWLRPKLIPWAE